MPKLVYQDERVVFFAEDRLFVCGFRDAPTMVQMQALAETARPIESERGPLALLNIAYGGRPRFSEDVRKIAAQYTRDPDLFGMARAHVVLMSGMAGAAVLAFINTFLLLGRPPRPTRVCGSVSAATQWLAPMLSWEASRLDDAAEHVRQFVGPV